MGAKRRLDLGNVVGDKGDRGTTYIPSVSDDGVLSWSNDDGEPNPTPVSIKGEQGTQGIQGVKGDTGAKGDKGDTGTTFTPSVSSDGDLSWTNDGGLANPATVNIKGERGDKGEKGDKGDKGDAGKDGTGTSAYDAARNGGYTGTEAEFNAVLAVIDKHASRHASGGADPLTPANIGAVALSGGVQSTMTGHLLSNLGGSSTAEGGGFVATGAAAYIEAYDDFNEVYGIRRQLVLRNISTVDDDISALILASYNGSTWSSATVLTALNASIFVTPETIGAVPLGGNASTATTLSQTLAINKGGTASANQQNALYNLGAHTNPNLLDNWYFVDPINQRGDTSISSGVYFIDRWKSTNSNATFTLTGDGVKIQDNSESAYGYFRQYLEDTPPDGTYTYSALVRGEGTGGFIGVILDANSSTIKSASFNNALDSEKFTIISLTFDTLATNEFWQAYIRSNSSTGWIEVAAVKLERGSTQTLARQDSSGNWVLLDPPPNKQQELAKCQRYQVAMIDPLVTNSQCGYAVAYGTTAAQMQINLPANMRTRPTAEFSGVALLEPTNGNTSYPITAVSIPRSGGNTAKLTITCSGGGLTAGNSYAVSTTSTGTLILNANL